MQPLVDSNGKLLATITEFIDISEYIDTQKKYTINSTYLRAIANNFYAGIIFIIDTSHKIVF
jgi:hypothetical protein